MRRTWRSLTICLTAFAVTAGGYAQNPEKDAELSELDRVSVPANGAGVMIAGELWDSFLPPSVGPYYTERGDSLWPTFLRMGNFERAWGTPTHMWPGGWDLGIYWGKGMLLSEYNPDTTWNPAMIAGSPNPAHTVLGGAHYSLGMSNAKVVGADDPQRRYARETQWVDPTKRHHAIYEAGWPTNIGVDVKITIHQFTLNWNNFNDFIIVEIALTNTGVLDMNGDGIPDSLQTGRAGRNRLNALTVMAHGEVFGMYRLSRSGGRGTRFGSSRAIGYVGDPDTAGAPWDMMVYFPGESAPLVRDMGLNVADVTKWYTDVWAAWAWVAVKEGTAASSSLHQLPDKRTIYGTHGIGTGSERGWYATSGHGRGLGNFPDTDNPRSIHTASMGTWYRDGGKSRSTFDLSPDTSFFASGVPGDPTSFVPKLFPGRPQGDIKLLNIREKEPYETRWKKGFTSTNDFDGDMFHAVGPFSLDVGETMTVVWAEGSGFRLAGVQNAIAAARWAFENSYTIPEPPAVPEMTVTNTLKKSVRVRWDARAETDPGFAGYKIYRVTGFKPIDWIEGGMRGLDEYWRNTEPGPTPASLLEPINPYFQAFALVDTVGGSAGAWGPYELVAAIPAGSRLSGFADPSVTGFSYSWEDRNVQLGFPYWYYVCAYTQGTYDLGPAYAGLQSASTSTIETSNVNRNGASGLWEGTYPFADLNVDFPKSPDGLKAIGAGFTVRSDVLRPETGARVGVAPNPYKKKAFWDSRADTFDHRIMFFNLPSRATITILDVSGQVIDRIIFEASDPNNGTVYWDMFSKDGIEVASGLYIYVVESEGRKQVGYLSILR
jgi:hypothetical protein